MTASGTMSVTRSGHGRCGSSPADTGSYNRNKKISVKVNELSSGTIDANLVESSPVAMMEDHALTPPVCLVVAERNRSPRA